MFAASFSNLKIMQGDPPCENPLKNYKSSLKSPLKSFNFDLIKLYELC